jgi:hypothetical protein
MALIDGIGVQGPRRTGAVRARPGTPAWRGIIPGETEPRASGSVSGAAPSPALEGLLALQETIGEAEADRQAREHGRQLLDTLAVLQRTILLEGDPAVVLQQLAEMTAAEPAVADPALAFALRAIRLRVLVELARRSA